jgi:hypothetical protein
MVDAEGGDAIATIAFDGGTVFLTTEHSAIRFGRSAECPVRFAHQPVADLGVPRVAGVIRVIGHRVAVENLSQKVAFDVKTPDAPVEVVRPDMLVAPPGEWFEIRYGGSRDVYVIHVHRHPVPAPLPDRHPGQVDDEVPTRVDPDLTSRQWQMLAAYTEPLRRGGTSPATHREVAERLHWSHATIRVECHAIWGAFKVAGVPMRQFRDKRDAVIDAAVRHRLARHDT